VVTLADGESYSAKIVGGDPSNDLAVLHIDADELPAPISLGDSTQLRVGQFVVAIGNPFGLDRTLTVGVISSLGRVIQGTDGRFIGEAIQTDAAINPGNSGGPLLDLDGNLIGVNSQIVSTSNSSAGIGFAVPVNTVSRVVPELITSGHYPHPWLGTQMLSVTAERARAFRQAGMEIPVEEGLLVISVVPGGPADEAGMHGGDRTVRFANVSLPLGGDIITAIDDVPMTSLQDLTIYLDTHTRVGDSVAVTFIRDGAEQVVQMSLQERPQE
jgi:S1-C subfamily serine protease